MQKFPILCVLAVLAFPGCTAIKSMYGTPMRNQVVTKACQDGLVDLEQIHAMLMHQQLDPAEQAKLQHLHDTIQMALKNCVTVGESN